MRSMAKKTKKQKITELEKLLQRVPVERQYIARQLVEELVFINEALGKLKEIIREHGPEEPFKQGEQTFTRERPAMSSYIKLVPRYATLYRQFNELLGKVPEAERANAVYDFLKEQ